jgi:hypothetical protein
MCRTEDGARRAADAVRARAEGCGRDSVSAGPSGRARPLDALLSAEQLSHGRSRSARNTPVWETRNLSIHGLNCGTASVSIMLGVLLQ